MGEGGVSDVVEQGGIAEGGGKLFHLGVADLDVFDILAQIPEEALDKLRRQMVGAQRVDEPDNLWPIALPERYAAVPEQKITAEDLVGTWEHISLSYKYAEQRTSRKLELAADGTVSGALKGTWTYDEAKKWLTFEVGEDKVVVCVELEVDWEASPRDVTLVYAGTEKSLNATWWGKKVQ